MRSFRQGRNGAASDARRSRSPSSRSRSPGRTSRHCSDVRTERRARRRSVGRTPPRAAFRRPIPETSRGLRGKSSRRAQWMWGPTDGSAPSLAESVRPILSNRSRRWRQLHPRRGVGRRVGRIELNAFCASSRIRWTTSGMRRRPFVTASRCARLSSRVRLRPPGIEGDGLCQALRRRASTIPE